MGAVAIIGAGPYGLSIAAHLAARHVEHRIFGRPMQFWSQITDAGGERYLKSFCFGTNISSPVPGSSFSDYSTPRGLETFEPCSMGQFTAYGLWFQQRNVPWVEPINVSRVEKHGDAFAVTLENGDCMNSTDVVVATGLDYFDHLPQALATLPPGLAIHTSKIRKFAEYKGRDVAVIGAGQSALEAAALLNEVGARPILLVRESSILWHSRYSHERSLWQRMRTPLSGLGVGLKAWALTNLPGAAHRLPSRWRTRFVKSHLPAEGAWWLRERVEARVPIHFGTTVVAAETKGSRVALELEKSDNGRHTILVDHVVAGTGYRVDVDRLAFLSHPLRQAVDRLGHAPNLNATFESSVPGLRFIGSSSAMSFGPLFRFVIGADYSARVVASKLASTSLGPARYLTPGLPLSPNSRKPVAAITDATPPESASNPTM
jgi:FAD-dependent urate hydroxylase